MVLVLWSTKILKYVRLGPNSGTRNERIPNYQNKNGSNEINGSKIPSNQAECFDNKGLPKNDVQTDLGIPLNDNTFIRIENGYLFRWRPTFSFHYS